MEFLFSPLSFFSSWFFFPFFLFFLFNDTSQVSWIIPSTRKGSLVSVGRVREEGPRTPSRSSRCPLDPTDGHGRHAVSPSMDEKSGSNAHKEGIC